LNRSSGSGGGVGLGVGAAMGLGMDIGVESAVMAWEVLVGAGEADLTATGEPGTNRAAAPSPTRMTSTIAHRSAWLPQPARREGGRPRSRPLRRRGGGPAAAGGNGMGAGAFGIGMAGRRRGGVGACVGVDPRRGGWSALDRRLSDGTGNLGSSGGIKGTDGS
jgi:hypothetical protein